MHPRTLRLGFILVFAFALACIDGDEILNGLCRDGSDCWRNQTCVTTGLQGRTAPQLGYCRPEGDGCAPGEQPGCRCKADSAGVGGTCDSPLFASEGVDGAATCGCCEACMSSETAIWLGDEKLDCVCCPTECPDGSDPDLSANANPPRCECPQPMGDSGGSSSTG